MNKRMRAMMSSPSLLLSLLSLQMCAALPDSPGGQEVTRSRRDTSTVLSQVADIDYQMYQTLQSMPLAIQEARADIIQGTSDTNRDKAITGVACLLGAVSGGLDVTDGVSSPTVGVVLGWLAQHTWGYGYWGPFLLDFEELDPGCGVEDFNSVLADYSFVTSLYSTYGSQLDSGAYTSGHPDDRPELRAYYMSEFGRKAKLALHCITSKAGDESSAAKVVTLIDKYGNPYTGFEYNKLGPGVHFRACEK